jgi:hypothetical protein
LATLITGFVAIGAAFVVLVASCTDGGGSTGRAQGSDSRASSSASVLTLAGDHAVATASSMAIAAAAAAPAPVVAAANSNPVGGVALAPPSHSASPPAKSTSPAPTPRSSAAPSRSSTLVVVGSACSRAGTVARATTGRYAVCWSGADRVLKWYSL